MRGHVALREDRRALRVEPGREQHRGQVERRLAELVRVVVDADRVQVDDAEERPRPALGSSRTGGSRRSGCRGSWRRWAGCRRRCACRFSLSFWFDRGTKTTSGRRSGSSEAACASSAGSRSARTARTRPREGSRESSGRRIGPTPQTRNYTHSDGCSRLPRAPDRDGCTGVLRTGGRGRRAPRGGRRERARQPRPRRDGDRRDRRARAARDPAARGLPRRRAGAADPEALQARFARAAPRPDRDRGARPQARRPLLRLHRRPVHGRDARADARDGASRRRRGRDDAPRRRLQAAHVALRVPGARRRGAEDPRRGSRRDRACRS